MHESVMTSSMMTPSQVIQRIQALSFTIRMSSIKLRTHEHAVRAHHINGWIRGTNLCHAAFCKRVHAARLQHSVRVHLATCPNQLQIS